MSISTGDKVSWNSSGGTANGIVRQIVRDGSVPDIPVKVTGSEEEPAARIEIVDDEGKPTGEMVGHKLSTLNKSIEKAEYDGREVELDKPFRLPSGSSKKFGVYVKDGDKTKKVTFGSPDMEIRRDDPDARANFRARHNCDTATDKTSARYWSCRFWEEDISVSEMTKTDIEGKVLKTDEEQRMVWGWASVVTEKGEPVVDRQGDVIEPETLVKAVNKFMQYVRVGKEMHDGGQIGVVVHSMPITKEIGDSLGIQSDREGWVVAFKVYDDDVWAKVKSGELAAFSIGGRAVKEDYNG
jgi:phage head maturation protease